MWSLKYGKSVLPNILTRLYGLKYTLMPFLLKLVGYVYKFTHIYTFVIVKMQFSAFRASFTKQGKLARECNSKTAPMGGEIYAGDLLAMRKLNNTDATCHLHIDQHNISSAAQISVVANKE